MLLKKKLLPIFSLKGSIIFGFLVLLFVTFVTMFGYRYIENNKANVTIGESFINFTHTTIISRLEKEFSNIQFLSGLGDQLYNTEKEVDLNNPNSGLRSKQQGIVIAMTATRCFIYTLNPEVELIAFQSLKYRAKKGGI